MAYIMNVDFYNNLPDDLKAVVDEGAAQATQAALDVVVNRSEECVQELKDYGMQVYEPTAEEKAERSDYSNDWLPSGQATVTPMQGDNGRHGRLCAQRCGRRGDGWPGRCGRGD